MVQIYCVNITEMDEQTHQQLYTHATPARKSRAARYPRREDSLRCLAADALLRLALGTNAYETHTQAAGKPSILGRDDFFYNISHSGPWVVLAFGTSQVGVDVERYREDRDIRSFARRFFTPEEIRYCLETEENSYGHFYQVWTGKESYVKYLGIGLQKDLRSFSVFAPGDDIRIHHRILPDGSSLSLCTKEDSCSLTFISTETLLSL